jgi:hypothetical protein
MRYISSKSERTVFLNDTSFMTHSKLREIVREAPM